MGQLQMHYCCCLNYFFQVNKFLKKWVRKTGSYLSPLKNGAPMVLYRNIVSILSTLYYTSLYYCASGTFH